MTDYRKQYREAQRVQSSRFLIPLAALGLFLLLSLLLLLFRPHRGEPLSSVAEPSFEAEKVLSRSLAERDPAAIPPYGGQLWVELEGGRPAFTEDDAELIWEEVYAPLDALGRCGTAYARLDSYRLPAEDREPIGAVKPSGWHTVSYPELIPERYLYNRCHLIAFALSGENANECNLITGTRQMNMSGMAPFENKVRRYLQNEGGSVLYRVTPLFIGEELVARGVEMEAYSLRDRGEALCFHVFVYNVQEGIVIDYTTGESHAAS